MRIQFLLGFVHCLFCAAAPLRAADQDPADSAVEQSTSDQTSDSPLSEVERAPQRTIGSHDWHTDYAFAYREARDAKKMLLILFRDEKQPRTADRFEREVLAHKDLGGLLAQVVRVVLPLDVPRPAAEPDQPAKTLLSHSSFEHMYGRQGIAVIDLTHPGTELYGQVTSAHPFKYEGQYSTWNTRAILALPRATQTQRALIYTVRINPSAPISTTAGQCDGYLCSQARQASQLMAQYGSVGHHDWGTRYGAIAAATGRSASEVAAMGGNRELLDAAAELVNQWQGSPTHWGIMSSPAALFGYDMVRGAGGAWWGTGVFAN